MSGIKEEKGPVSFYLPKQIIETIDLKRGRVSRSTFLAILLERILINRRKKVVPIGAPAND